MTQKCARGCFAPFLLFVYKKKKGGEWVEWSSLRSKGGLIQRNYTVNSNSRRDGFNFSSYLAGLIEGDGTIHVPKTERSSKGNLNYPSIQIVFHLKDLPLALLIQKEIDHGSQKRCKCLYLHCK